MKTSDNFCSQPHARLSFWDINSGAGCLNSDSGSPKGLQVLLQRGSWARGAALLQATLRPGHTGCAMPQSRSLRQRLSWQIWCPAVSRSAFCGYRLPSPTAACFHLPLLRGSGKLSWIIFSSDGGIYFLFISPHCSSSPLPKGRGLAQFNMNMLLNVMLQLPNGPAHTAPEIPMLPCSGQYAKPHH